MRSLFCLLSVALVLLGTWLERTLSFQPASFTFRRRRRRFARQPRHLVSRIHATADVVNSIEVPRRNGETTSTHASDYDSLSELNAAIKELSNRNETCLLLAVELVKSAEQLEPISPCRPNAETYITILKAVANQPRLSDAQDLAEDLFKRAKKHCGSTVTVDAYNALITSWSKSGHANASRRAEELLDELWSLHNEKLDSSDDTYNNQYCPNRGTYMGVMNTIAAENKGGQAAQRVEGLLEEMEMQSHHYSHLSPTSAFVNVVLNAWSKSGARGAADRCTVVLKRMEDLALNGRPELQPTTFSFNIALDCLARSEAMEWRAEELLQQMDQLSLEQGFLCEPDTFSFNTVINCWSRSRQHGAAQRAEEILKHMEKRYESKETQVRPDCASYSSVIHAWSRSQDPSKRQKADRILERMQHSYENGNTDARPNTMVYNTIINVWAKSHEPDAADRALVMLDHMKKHGLEPDVFTYTSLIDALAKTGTPEATAKAQSLLDEMDDEFRQTGRCEIQPNVRTYTSVINAIARSNENPDQAEAILDRMTQTGVYPDAVSYNAVINAFGHCMLRDKEVRAYDILDRMIESCEDGNEFAKPDIITCNSIINACAFAVTNNDADKQDQAIQIAIQTLERFQSVAPQFGWPNHMTYSNMLTVFSRQMPLSEKRCDLAEATFWQCCEAGHVSTLVIHSLRRAVTPERLANILGPALKVNNEDSFKFDMAEMPSKWKQFAPRRNARRRDSKPSIKINEPQITKQNNR